MLSLPNGTSISAEMYQLYREFKCFTRASTEDIFNEKVYEQSMLLKEKKEHPERKIVVPTVVSLSNENLPRMINGRPDNLIEKRPFERTFTIERIQK